MGWHLMSERWSANRVGPHLCPPKEVLMPWIVTLTCSSCGHWMEAGSLPTHAELTHQHRAPSKPRHLSEVSKTVSNPAGEADPRCPVISTSWVDDLDRMWDL